MKCLADQKENDNYSGRIVKIHSALVMCHHRTGKCVAVAVWLIHQYLHIAGLLRGGGGSVTSDGLSCVPKYIPFCTFSLYCFSLSKYKYFRPCGTIRTSFTPLRDLGLWLKIEVLTCLVQYLLSDSGLCWILQRKLKHLHHTQKSRLLEYILLSSSIPHHIFPCAAVLISRYESWLPFQQFGACNALLSLSTPFTSSKNKYVMDK